MKRLNLNGPQDYLALLVRRKWWVIIPFIGLSCAIMVLTYVLPKTYVSETLTLIRPRDVPNDFVRDLIAGTDQQRLSAIEQTVLSRTNLVQILQEFEEKMPDYKGLNVDQRVSKLRNRITISFQLEGRSGLQVPGTYFRISYQNQNPELAQKIASKLTSLFIEQDSRTRETQVYGTSEFFSGELEKLTEQLKQSDSKLKDLKAHRRYSLPDQLETNLRTLDRLGLAKQANGEALDRNATIRLNLERQIAETAPVIVQQKPEARPAADPLVEQYRKKQRDFELLSAKYTPRHPELVAATAELERLKAKIPPGELVPEEKIADAAPATTPNPVYQRLTAQLLEVDTELEILKREKESIASEVERYSQRVQNEPQSEQEIAAILRENTDLNKQYDELKSKLTQAKLSVSLESKQKGSQFVVVDPANYPLSPTKPVKWAIALVGALISLVVGIATATAVDLINQKLWTQTEVESLFDIPVLIEIPQIVTNEDLAQAHRKQWRLAASSTAAVLAYTACLYAIYLKQTPVLRQLDPLIQRLMY